MSVSHGISFQEKNLRTELNAYQATAESAVFSKEEAQKIILDLIENEVSAEVLIKKILYITPEQYEDVVNERAISAICGYPLCNLKLVPQYASQNYIIRHNQVYDITWRKNFCSDICFEASNIVQNQVPKLPLYLRKSDRQIKTFKLHVPDKSKLRGRYGKLVNIGGFQYEEDENTDSTCLPSNETCKLKKKSSSLKQSVKKEPNIDTSSSSSSISHQNDFPQIDGIQKIKPINIQNKDTCLDIISPAYDTVKIEESSKANDCQMKNKSQTNLKDSRQEENLFENVSSKISFKKEPHKKINPLELLIEIEQNMRQWMTFESLRMILGDKYVRGMLEELGKTWEDYDTTTGLRLGVESKSRYISLCKKLDREEREEAICNQKEPLPDEEKRTLGHVPNFNQLQLDVDEQALKVKAFFEGKEEFSTTVPVQKLDSIPEEIENKEKSNNEEHKMESNPEKKLKSRENIRRKNNKNEADTDFDPVTLPLIDSHEQCAWRQQIFFEKISKRLSALSCDFGLDEGQIRKLLKPLIASFDLQPHNITFRLIQWEYIALILLKMLCVRYPTVSEAMTNTNGCNIIKALLSKVNLDPSYLERILSYLTEIVFILGKYHNSNDNAGKSMGNVEMPRNSMSSPMEQIKQSDNLLSNVLTSATNEIDKFTEVIATKMENSLDFEDHSQVNDNSKNKNYGDVANKNACDVQELVVKTDVLQLQDKFSTNLEELD